MFNPETDVLFPPRILPALRELRSEPWWKLVTTVLDAGPDSLDQMAFVLLMARMNACITCNADSFRAMSGCAACSTQTLKKFHESDDALILLYRAACTEVDQYLQKKTFPISR